MLDRHQIRQLPHALLDTMEGGVLDQHVNGAKLEAFHLENIKPT